MTAGGVPVSPRTQEACQMHHALMAMVQEFFYEASDGSLQHFGTNAERMAIHALMDAGLAKNVGKCATNLASDKYVLLWDKLTVAAA
ncbi:MAG: hypothetical protein ACYDB0_07040 [Acidithiobacillus sp.]